MNGKIYCLKDPMTNEVRYVGFTRSTLKTRFSQHKHEALKRNKKTHVYNWFRNCVLTIGIPYIELLEENISVEKWEEKENYWISKFTNLTNQNEGGCGVHLNTNGKGRASSIDNKKKAIVQVSSDGKLIKEWPSSVEAEIFYKGKHTGNIFSSIDNGSKAFGFYWFKKEKYKEGFIPTRKLEKPIFLYCLFTNKLIKKYEISKDLSREFNCVQSIMNQALNKNLVFMNLYYLRRSEDKNINFPEKRRIYTLNNKYYNKFSDLYNDNEFKYGYAQHRKDSESYLVKEITKEIIQKLRLSNTKRN